MPTWARFSEMRTPGHLLCAGRGVTRLGETFVSTEHVLLALTRDSESAAAHVLEQLGVSLSAVAHRGGEAGDARTEQGVVTKRSSPLAPSA
jgi:ATP-dependent Clp protease ATP-binding subunit ClpA